MSQRQHQRGGGGGYSEVKVKGMIERFLGAPNFPFWDNFLGQENLASKLLVFLGLSIDFLVQSKESEDWCCNVGVCWLQRSRPPSEEKTDNSDGLMKRQS